MVITFKNSPDFILNGGIKMSFAKVKCSKCNNEQVINLKPSMEVVCLVCQEVLAKSTGGKAELKAQVIKEC